MTEEFIIGKLYCPWCEHFVDRASHLRERSDPPQAGDIVFCIQCAQPAIFTKKMKLRRPTKVEQLVIDHNEEAQRLSQAIRSIPRKHQP